MTEWQQLVYFEKTRRESGPSAQQRKEKVEVYRDFGYPEPELLKHAWKPF